MSDSIGVTKYEENTAVVTARIHNRGGYPVPFEISNVPAWARVVPDQGTLVANEVREISVYIDSSLTLGNWHDTLVMTTLPGINPFFMGGSENLPLGVRVICHAPEWYVNPASYSYSMNMTLQLNIENILSTDVQDRVGAFINGKLAGVGRVQYYADLNKYLVFLTIYSNDAVGDMVTFQIWDASACLIYGNILEEFPYTVDELIGTPNVPQVLHTNGQVLNKIQLVKGWNWISYNVVLDSTEVNPALSSLTHPQNGLIKNQTQFSLYSQTLSSWQGSLDTLSPFTSFQMKLGARDSLSLIGGIVDPETPIPLVAGWNWIGYLPQRGQDLATALSSLSPSNGDIIKSQTAFAQYVNGFGWIGNLSYMSSPNGYLLKLANPDILIYPPPANLRDVPDFVQYMKKMTVKDQDVLLKDEVQNRNISWTIVPQKFEYNMNAVVVAEDFQGGNLLETGDVIGVFAGDEIRGVGEVAYIPQLGIHVCFLTMYANREGEVLSFKIFDASKDVVYTAIESQNFISNQILGSVENPWVLHVQNTTGVEDLSESGKLFVYPNPASNVIHISLTSPFDFVMPCVLTDVTGKKVHVSEEKIKAGGNTIEIKVDPKWQTGPYMINCTTPDQVISRMVLIVK
ncbi:MAG: T9SS type A sorting domain-containing protein [Saprospiraceae bacterium]|nr:T9SS type A sorting domain-containing protein [Saprospiraceae bacterium]